MNYQNFQLWALILSINSYTLCAQTQTSYLLKKIQIKGLPSVTHFSSLHQDKDGFMWIGSLSGLYRYDGTRVTKFLRDPSDTNSLTHNYAKSLALDGRGNLWVGTYGGFMNMYDRYAGKIKRIEPRIKTQTRVTVMAVKLSSNETILAATAQCIYRISQHGKVTDSILLFTDQNRISDFYEYEAGKLLVASTNGLHLLDMKTKKTNQLLLPTQLKSFTSIERGTADTLWIGGSPGMILLSSKTFQIINAGMVDSVKNTAVRSIRKDSKGRFWIGTTEGLFLSENNRLMKIESTDTLVKPLQITDVYVDNSDMVWIATAYNGLFQAYQPSLFFHHIPGLSQVIAKRQIQSLLEETPGTWLIGTTDGLYRYQFSEQKFESIDLPAKEKKISIQCLFKDRKNTLWIGTALSGLFYRTAGAGQFVQIKHDPLNDLSLSSNSVMALEEDKYGLIWIGTYNDGSKMNSLCYYNPSTKQTTRIKTDVSNPNYMHASSISQIKADAQGKLWIASWDHGLFRYDLSDNVPAQNAFTAYSEAVPDFHKISHDVVTSVKPARNGQIWFGTVSGGVNVLDTKTDRVNWYTIKDGLASNLVYRIEEDEQGVIWISTDNGLSRFDPATKSFMNYNISSGLTSDNFAFLSSLKCSDGTIAFGISDGNVIYFNPNTFQSSSNRQPVVITDIRLDNQPVFPSDNTVLTKAAYVSDTVYLNYDQNVISFDLANMDFINPENYTYAYKLEGFDKDWTYITDRNSITYTNLDPGPYTLLIKNANHHGTWNDSPTKLVLVVKPPYWKTWWFRSLIVLAMASGIYLLFRYRLQQKLKIFGVRQRLHRDLHDDVGATLSSVKVYSEILGKNGNNEVIGSLIKENATEMIERLEVISWATNPQYDNLRSLVDAMLKFARPITYANNIEFRFEKNDFNDDMMIPGDVRQNVLLIFKEAINNLLKYAEATECHVNLWVKNQRMLLAIKDNGKGSDGTIKGGGAGLKNMQKRAEEMNGQLETQSSPTNGTIVRLIIPYPFKIPKTWYQKRTPN